MIVNDVVVSEKRDIQCLTYVLSKSDLFLYTSYKVLKSHEDNGFAKCNKIKFNGKDKLLYDIAKYKSLDCVLPTISYNTFSIIMINFLKIILQVKENGFMKCENIDLSIDKIFVDINSCRVYLIYLPIESCDIDTQKNHVQFEIGLRKLIYGLLTMNKNIINERTMYICNNIYNSSYSLYDVIDVLRGKKVEINRNYNINNNYNVNNSFANFNQNNVIEYAKGNLCQLARDNRMGNRQMVLKSINTYINTKICINKVEFVIGKKIGKVDFAITNNSTVSRIHCKIVLKNGIYYIIDLGSSNGTYVNGKRIFAYQAVPIKIGDNIKISNLHFILDVD